MAWWKVLWRYSLFEAADSGWSLIVVSTYFATLIQVAFGRPAADFGWVVTFAALIIAVVSPLLGARADTTGARQPYLRICVAVAGVATAALSFVHSLPAALICFAVAYIAVQVGFMFFTAMLPAVSTPKTVATVTSMTVGVGYVGALACIVAFSAIARSDAQVADVFLPMGLVYVLFAAPTMFASPDFARRAAPNEGWNAPYLRLRNTFRNARAHGPLFRFLIGDFLYENAVASVITLMGLYSRNVMGFSAAELKALFGPSLVVAALSAWFLYPRIVRALGPKRAVLIVLAIWLALFAALLAIPPEASLVVAGHKLAAKTLFASVAAPLAGLGLAGVWSTSRVLLTALTPVERSGEFWGLYALSGRSASVLGDLSWTAILTLVGETAAGYHAAVLALAVYVVLGAGFIISLPDARPRAENFLRA
jgi:UMF1 family MFS transporter